MEAFLAGRIPFPAIAQTIESAVDRWGVADEPELEGIIGLDAEIRSTLAEALA